MSELIHVLHVIDTYRIGGPGKTIVNSARYIDQSRYRVHVASFTSLNENRNEFANRVRETGIPYLPLPETRRVNLSHLGMIREYVRRERISILHLHGYRTDALGYIATRGLPVAIVTTHHGWIRNSSRQHLLTRVALQLCRLFHGVELVSEQMRAALPSGLRSSDRVSVVRNGIVLDDYVTRGRRDDVRRALGIEQDAPLLGVIGRLSIEKGCFEMLDVFRRVLERLAAARLVFVGEGPLKAEMEQRVHDGGLSTAVRFVTHQREVQPYFEAIDMLVSPSRSEGLSNVILEALALRRPVVATQVGGNAEIIEDGVSGLLVKSGDIAGLADAIVRVLADPALAERLTTGGFDRVLHEFAFTARMRAEERFYEAALGRAGLLANQSLVHA